MKTDLYTKVILTIIAAALVIIVIKDINPFKTAHAAPASKEVIDVNIKSVDSWITVPVEVKNSRYSAVPVEIK